MKAFIFSSTSFIYLVLAGAAVLSWYLGADHGFGPDTAPAKITIAVMLVAFFKVRLVIRHFMEVRHAPIQLKLITDAWIGIACGAVIGLYLLA